MGNGLDLFLHPDRVGIETQHVSRLDLSDCIKKKRKGTYYHTSRIRSTMVISAVLSRFTKVRELLLHDNEPASDELEYIVEDLVSPHLVMGDVHNNELDNLNQLLEDFGTYEDLSLDPRHNRFKIRPPSRLPLDDRPVTVREIAEFLASVQRKITDIEVNLKRIARVLDTQLMKQKVFKSVTVSKQVYSLNESADIRYVPLTIDKNLQIRLIHYGGGNAGLRPITKDTVRVNLSGLNRFNAYREFEYYEVEEWIERTREYIPKEILEIIAINTLQTSVSFEKSKEDEQTSSEDITTIASRFTALKEYIPMYILEKAEIITLQTSVSSEEKKESGQISSEDIAIIASRIAALKQMAHQINKEAAALKLIVTRAEYDKVTPIPFCYVFGVGEGFRVALIGSRDRIESSEAKDLVKRIAQMHGYEGIITKLTYDAPDDAFEFENCPPYELMNSYWLK